MENCVDVNVTDEIVTQFAINVRDINKDDLNTKSMYIVYR